MQYNFLTFAVENGQVEVREFDQYECRGDNALKILHTLVNKAPEQFEGRTGVMSFWDSPPDESMADSFDLAFCSTKVAGRESAFIEMPCPYSLSWPQVGVMDGELLMRELLDHNAPPVSNKMFWIGAETHPSRRRLHELSFEYPDVLDAELMSWNRETGEIRLKSHSRYVSLREHAEFRYLIDCPGAGYSGRVRWLLASGRPVLLVDRPLVEHWHEDMVPWVHYIPVRDDLSDLISAYERVESDPNLYDYISKNAKTFVREHLLFDRQIDRMLKMIASPSRVKAG